MSKKIEFLSCSPDEAQKQCNFVIFVPTFLPLGVVIREQHLRPESTVNRDKRENNRSTFRQVFEGVDRKLIIKQFLYDWAPPAYDYPCLWRNNKIATKTESPAPTGQFVNNNVLWFGKNYRKQEAATIEIERTRIEMTFEKGAFSREEVVSFCKSLSPVNTEIAKQILSVPFSELSYSHRYEESVVSVPVGYWKHSRADELTCFSLVPEDIPVKFLQAIQPFNVALKTRNYILSGGFGFGKSKDHLEEVEFIFEYLNAPGCFIRVLCTQTNSSFSILIPPILSDQECANKTLNICENIFYYATSMNFAFGSHEIVFNNDSFNFMIIIKPAPWTNFEWVSDLLASFKDA
jgi:hypothetical protein